MKLINIMSNTNFFELFKGSGSVGKVASKLGYNVISLDFDPIYTPDIEYLRVIFECL